MNNTKYKWILNIIVAVIICTIGIQIYWNYKNYEVNKHRLVNDVQVSLDQAIEKYYANLAEKHTVGFAFETSAHDSIYGNNLVLDSILGKFDFSTRTLKGLDSLDVTLNTDGVLVYKGLHADSLLKSIHNNRPRHLPQTRRLELSHLNYGRDSLVPGNLERLTSKVVISMTNDTISLSEIDSLFEIEVLNKQLNIDHKLEMIHAKSDSLHSNKTNDNRLFTTSKSPFLSGNNQIAVNFSNATVEILRRGLSGIFISTLLVLAVISCLIYLLKIINNQKQLAEIKNDLISNITHEFKTPIATIGVAVEGIRNFDVLKDREKTKSYLDMSKQQLEKLNTMVEKLLETATLDSESLSLHKSKVDINTLIFSITEKHKMVIGSKTINTNLFDTSLEINIDEFHIENALNNVIDNAVKYGGDNINISVKNEDSTVVIDISDSGNSLKNTDKEKIFEKFYRVPKGNTHDVKGFGIGLYYAKKVIEKHEGTVTLNLSNNLTTFRIKLPNG